MPKKRNPSYELTPARLGDKDLNPIQTMQLYKAVKSRKKQAELQGVLFDLEYSRGKVFYRKNKDMLPCGWTSEETLRRQLETMEVLDDSKAN